MKIERNDFLEKLIIHKENLKSISIKTVGEIK